MVRCAICDHRATTRYISKDEGELEVCEYHYNCLIQCDSKETAIAELKESFRDILIKIIHELNQHHVKIPINSTPAKSHYNRGWKFGLKQGILAVSLPLEELIKELKK